MAAPALSATMSRAAPGLFSSASRTIALDCSTVSTHSVRGSCSGRPKRSGCTLYSSILPSFNSPIMVLPLIEISSRPSRPNTVIAWRAPRRCSTRIWIPTRSGWNTPISWVGAPAGLVSGPRMLKIVLTPSSRRTGAACFIAVWWLGANMKPTPASSMHCATCAGLRLILTPSASSTSALPDCEDTARPPCLATRAPAAAATKMAAVEMLKVRAPSPPVPTTSTRLCASLTSTLVASSRITWAAAVISPMVSFFTRSAMVIAAIITGDICPLMIWRIRSSISSWKISRCSIARSSASCGVMDMVRFLSEKIFQQCVTVFGEYRFGMELHALERELPVAHPHDLAVFALGGDFQAVGQAGALDRERVIAGREERRRQPGKDALRCVADVGGLAVHHAARMHDTPAERLADRLVPQAHAEDGQLAGERAHEGHRDAGFVWGARAGRNDDARGRERGDAGEVDGVVAHHLHFFAQLAEILRQVVGEGIVIVDH